MTRAYFFFQFWKNLLYHAREVKGSNICSKTVTFSYHVSNTNVERPVKKKKTPNLNIGILDLQLFSHQKKKKSKKCKTLKKVQKIERVCCSYAQLQNGMNKSDVCILYIFLGHISYIEIFNFMESQPVFSSTISAHGKVKKSCLQKNKPSKQTKQKLWWKN